MFESVKVQLSESRRELSELKSALKVAQMEKEQLREEKQVRNKSVHRVQCKNILLFFYKWLRLILKIKAVSSVQDTGIVLDD